MTGLAETFDQHMMAIGIITVRWSAIDGLIYDILRKRLLLPEQAEKFRGCNAGEGRLNFFRARLKESRLRPDEKSSLDLAVSKLVDLCQIRNKIIHGQYGIMAGEDGSLSLCWSDIKLGKTEPSETWLEPAQVTVDHLNDHAAAVYETAAPLRNFLHQRE